MKGFHSVSIRLQRYLHAYLTVYNMTDGYSLSSVYVEHAEPVLAACCNAGDRLLEAASIAAAKAAEAAEATRQRMQSAENAQAASGNPSMEAGPSSAAVNTPPTKPARNKRYSQPNAIKSLEHTVTMPV